MIVIGEGLAIGENEVEITFIRSSGPGGQNVNKVSSAAQLRFDAAHSPALPETMRRRLIGLAGARASKDGVIVITARRYRSPERNRAEAIERLARLIRKAAEPVVPRRRTAVPRAQRRARLAAKARRSNIKAMRGPPAPET